MANIELHQIIDIVVSLSPEEHVLILAMLEKRMAAKRQEIFRQREHHAPAKEYFVPGWDCPACGKEVCVCKKIG